VVVKPKGAVRPLIELEAHSETPAVGTASLGPYQFIQEIQPGQWILATDPVLRRRVWLLRRGARELSPASRNLARQGRLRWLQKVEIEEATWDAFEAPEGVQFSRLVEDGKRIPWSDLRYWLHDLASELWAASNDQTLPPELSLDHVWVTQRGYAVLLNEPWPEVKISARTTSVSDVVGQQRFLDTIAANVESTSLPIHARPILRNLRDRKFEKLSFLAGTLRGLLDRPAEVTRGIRAGAIFMLPLYVWIMVFVGCHQGAEWLYQMVGDSLASIAMTTTILVLGSSALIQLLLLPFRTTFGHSVFRLAVVDAEGELAGMSDLLFRWAIIWLPLLIPLLFVALLMSSIELATAWVVALVCVLLWASTAAYAVIHPNRGLHDCWSGTWVVRQ
jgi:hypothetical protein